MTHKLRPAKPELSVLRMSKEFGTRGASGRVEQSRPSQRSAILQRNTPAILHENTPYNALPSGEGDLLQRTYGNQIVQRAAMSALRLGAVQDRFELEASAIADRVAGLSSGEPAGGMKATVAPPSIQRMSSETGTPLTSDLAHEIQSAHSNETLDSSVRRQMESSFGADFSKVRLHTGSNADTLNRKLDARAFTKGNDIFFRSGEYNPTTQQGKHLLAHELTHVVQQTHGTVQREMIQRVPTVDTAGGTWKANTYGTVVDGAEIELEFEPNNTVNAKKIGLIQTSLKIEKGKNYDTDARQRFEAGDDTLMPAQKRKAQRSDGTRHIDRDIRMNNPIYGAPNLAPGAAISSTPKGTLDMSAQAQRQGTAQNYQLGHRYKALGLITRTRSAKLYDKPNLPGALNELTRDPTKRSEMTFETTALALTGSQAGQYYGSVQWGWKLDDPDTGVELIPLSIKNAGSKSADMKQTMENWNQGEFSDGESNPQIPT